MPKRRWILLIAFSFGLFLLSWCTQFWWWIKNEAISSGVVEYSSGNYEEALKSFDKVINVDPQDAPIYVLRGSANAMLHKFQDAVQDYDKAIALYPSFSKRTWYNKANLNRDLARIYRERGVAKDNLLDFSGAIQDFNNVLTLDPTNNSDVYYNRGLVEIDVGEITTGCKDFKKVLASWYPWYTWAVELVNQYCK